jgi:hypothetical protein
MLMVGTDAPRVEQDLVAGELRCPACAGELRPWGHASRRTLRDGSRDVAVVPRRSRCQACRLTHVLLPLLALLRRRDLAEVIAQALLRRAAGAATARSPGPWAPRRKRCVDGSDASGTGRICCAATSRACSCCSIPRLGRSLPRPPRSGMSWRRSLPPGRPPAGASPPRRWAPSSPAPRVAGSSTRVRASPWSGRAAIIPPASPAASVRPWSKGEARG